VLWFSKKKVRFVYAEEYKFLGSTIMRGEQLSSIAEQYVREDIAYVPLTKGLRNSSLFLTKGCLLSLSRDDVRLLKRRGNRLFFDPVDSVLPDFTNDFADVIVAASKVAEEQYRINFPGKNILRVDHHVDPRIKERTARTEQSPLSIGYFGEPVNTIITPRIRQKVTFTHVDTLKQNPAWIKDLSRYNCHYAIRSKAKENVIKPFLKGFTAAKCGANILIQERGQEEAVHWLGNDYPFLLSGAVNEQNILRAISRLERSFGSTEWRRGLAIMEHIKQQVSDKNIALQLQQLLAM
jgi:hypothetical protein